MRNFLERAHILFLTGPSLFSPCPLKQARDVRPRDWDRWLGAFSFVITSAINVGDLRRHRGGAASASSALVRMRQGTRLKRAFGRLLHPQARPGTAAEGSGLLECAPGRLWDPGTPDSQLPGGVRRSRGRASAGSFAALGANAAGGSNRKFLSPGSSAAPLALPPNPLRFVPNSICCDPP